MVELIFTPIVIIGAARSGTNMLRNVVSQLPGFCTWPCDEINYIWRHGNAHCPSDEFLAEQASVSIKKYIRRAFSRIAQKHNCRYVVEKTCANSLRVSFVEMIVPEAKFIFLSRDGRDVVASAMKRWFAPLNTTYLLNKAKYVPITDIPYYASKYLMNRLNKIFSNEKRLSYWGPRFKGMEEMVLCKSLLEVCAVQWARCVEKSLEQLGDINPSRIHRIRYEDFVRNPAGEFRGLCDFLEVGIPLSEAERFVQGVSAKTVGTWRREFSENDLRVLNPLLGHPMNALGYLPEEGLSTRSLNACQES
jgi:hypothetical protein